MVGIELQRYVEGHQGIVEIPQLRERKTALSKCVGEVGSTSKALVEIRDRFA